MSNDIPTTNNNTVVGSQTNDGRYNGGGDEEETRIYYKSIIDSLSTSTNNNNEENKTLAEAIALATSSSSSSSSTTIQFNPQGLTDILVNDLLDEASTTNTNVGSSTATSSSSSSGLAIVEKLVTTDVDTYLPAVALSLLNVIRIRTKEDQKNKKKSITVSSNLLQLWMYQMIHSEIGKARSYFTDSLMLLLLHQQQQQQQETDFGTTDCDLLDDVCGLLCQIWKQAATSSGEDRKTGSVICVRCVSIFVRMLITTDDDGADNRILSTSSNAVELASLLGTMISNFDDPLQQMAVLDEIVQGGVGVAGTAIQQTTTDQMLLRRRDNMSPQLQEFWSSPGFMGPILQMLHDPILSSTAFQYISNLAVLDDGPHLKTVLDYIRDVGDPPPTSEKDRLILIHAIGSLVVQPNGGQYKFGRTLLDDQTVRCAWWGDLTRISNSKLQAAIIMSVRTAIVDLMTMMISGGTNNADSNSNDASTSLAVELYSKFGPDNDPALTTTQWLLQGRFVSNALTPEVRIATYSLLAAMVRIPFHSSSSTTVTNPILGRDFAGRTGLTNLLCSETRETSSDARKAYFDLLEAFVNNQGLMDQIDNDSNRKKLREKYAVGPHGVQPQRWDVATE